MVGGPPASLHRRAPFLAPERGNGGSEGHSGDRHDVSECIAVSLIDDRTLFGESFATAANAQAGDFKVTHRTSATALDHLPAILRNADIVVVSIGRASLSRGATRELLKALLSEDRHPPVAVLADAVSPTMVRTGIGMGLVGIISSTAPLGSVLDALRRVHRGVTVIPNLQ